jgi:hypothetical protein
MNPDNVLALTQQIRVSCDQIDTEVSEPVPPEPPEPGTVVSTTEALLAALEQGGVIELADAEFYHPSGFVLRVSQTTVHAPDGATVRADNQPAFWVKPGVCDVVLAGMTCLSNFSGAVILLGNNDSAQLTPELVPRRITIEDITIPTHRGKRGIEVNAGDVTITDCSIEDVSCSGQDSQAICVLNSPGNVTINGGTYSAASENIMLGGDKMKVPGQVITNVVIKNAHLYKPLSWKTDGVTRVIKNLFEIKAGDGVSLINCTLDGCWKAGQDGWAIMITPKNSQYVANVLIDGCTITNASAGITVMGEDYNTVTPQKTHGVVVRGSTFAVSKAQHGGRGTLFLVLDGIQDLTVEGVGFTGDGNCIIEGDSDEGSGPMGPCVFTGGHLQYLQYGVKWPGANYGDEVPPESGYYDERLIVSFTGNTFTGSPHSKFKANFPENTYPTMSVAEQTRIDRRWDLRRRRERIGER